MLKAHKIYSSKTLLRLFGIILFCYILYRIDFSKFIEYISYVNPFFAGLVILLNLPEVVLRALRWHVLLGYQKIRLPLLDTINIYLAGIFLGYLSPGKAGEISKAFYLKAETSVTVPRAFSSVLVDRLLDYYLLFILGLIGIWYFELFGSFTNTSLVILILFSLLFVSFVNHNIRNMAIRAGCKLIFIKTREEQVERYMSDFLSGVKELISVKIMIPILLTILTYAVFFIQCYLIAFAMNMQIDFFTTTLFMAISNLVNLLPISISGIGTRDTILIYLFSKVSLPPAMAVSYSLLVLVLLFVSTGLICSIAWWIMPFRWTENEEEMN